MRYRNVIGKSGEDFATSVLESNGYEIMERNYRTRLGEIDIIARKDGTLHFVEVKTRTQDQYGSPADSITREKKEHIRKVAQIYMSSTRIFWRRVSFDVFEVMTNMITDCI